MDKKQEGCKFNNGGEHLWGNIIVTAIGIEPKRYTACLNCWMPKLDEKAAKFHIEENLEIIKNCNVYNAEKYYNK